MAEKLKTEKEIFYLELCNDCDYPKNCIMYVDNTKTINTPNVNGILFTFACDLYDPLISVETRQILISNDKIYQRVYYAGNSWTNWE